MTNGDNFKESAPAPRGTPIVPVADEEIIEKYLKMAIPVLGEDKAKKLKRLVLDMDSQTNLSSLPGLISI